MNNNIKFTLIINKLNQKIAQLNIKISKDPNNVELKKKLNNLLIDKNRLYIGDTKDLEELSKKYGELKNE